MPGKKKIRLVDFEPEVTYFKPQGIPLSALQEEKLTLDELEAVRLVDYQGMGQVEAAAKMGVSQSTFQRILAVAHRKIAEALVTGKAIAVKGGEIKMIRPGRGRGPGMGGGRGRMGGGFAAGPGGTCICTNPECQTETAHQAGIPCYQMKCPKCGSPMIRKR